MTRLVLLLFWVLAPATAVARPPSAFGATPLREGALAIHAEAGWPYTRIGLTSGLFSAVDVGADLRATYGDHILPPWTWEPSVWGRYFVVGQDAVRLAGRLRVGLPLDLDGGRDDVTALRLEPGVALDLDVHDTFTPTVSFDVPLIVGLSSSFTRVGVTATAGVDTALGEDASVGLYLQALPSFGTGGSELDFALGVRGTLAP